MNHTVKYLALFSLAFSLAACDDDGLDVRDVEIPQGYALSAGILYHFPQQFRGL